MRFVLHRDSRVAQSGPSSFTRKTTKKRNGVHVDQTAQNLTNKEEYSDY